MPFRTVAAVVSGVLLLSASAVAQSAVVSGVVKDQTGLVLPGVAIDLVSGAEELTTVSDATGGFRFAAVPSGPAEITFRLLNFTVLRRSVEVKGASHTVDVVMTLSLDADVVVTAAKTFRNIADVENPFENLIGIASAASQGAVTSRDLEMHPIMRPGEILETVPGMVTSQHSGEGKANQYYLRGFNLDHGTDFATMVAGVPVNEPTGAHAHGYADIGFLIPELVSGVQYKKGPYYADEGDFSAAGAANINYVNRLDRPLVSVSVGGDGWGRVFAAASPSLGGGHMLTALELNHNDGPWVRADDFNKVNAVLRYSRGNTQNGFSITGMGYWADWQSSDQIPERAVSSGEISRFGLVDPSDYGKSNRQSVAFELQRSRGSSSLRTNAFVLRNSLDLFSNFTYFLDDPDNGDQFEQAEHRIAAGGRATYRRLGHLFERHTESAAGVQLRHDWLDPIGLYHTAARQRLRTTREDDVGMSMLAGYAQTEIEWTRWLRTTLGARADLYQFDVTSDNPANSGNGAATLVSPKLTAVFGPWRGTELYANAGGGFHSNDARGATIAVNPASGERVDPVTPLVRARGAELGMRTVRVRGLQSTAALWYLDLDSELVFVGDAGTTAAGRPSRRVGVEWTNHARLNPWLTLDADVSLTRARFTGDDPAGDEIPGALGRVISAGVTFEPPSRVFGSLRVRHFGPRPLVEDGDVRSRNTTVWNGEVGYRFSKSARVALEAFNLFDADVSDIDYFYRSRLPGEPVEGLDDVHTHPAIPRTARVALLVAF
ncbi:MAG TPA: TonB-dependent receptor [Vicinamibacterales bacterium]|nr:TonB-dependent receptor [Vicinamibacterales bacterium]